jgi:hypothetical protein
MLEERTCVTTSLRHVGFIVSIFRYCVAAYVTKYNEQILRVCLSYIQYYWLALQMKYLYVHCSMRTLHVNEM